MLLLFAVVSLFISLHLSRWNFQKAKEFQPRFVQINGSDLNFLFRGDEFVNYHGYLLLKLRKFLLPIFKRDR